MALGRATQSMTPTLHLAAHHRTAPFPSQRSTQRQAQSHQGKTLAEGLLTRAGYSRASLRRTEDRWTVHATPPAWLSLSHAGPWTLCALDLIAPLGMDVECTDRAIDHLYAAKHFMHPTSYAALKHLDGPEQSDAFFHLWTALEAHGKLLNLPLNQALAQPILTTKGFRSADSAYPQHRFFSRRIDAKHLVTLVCHASHKEAMLQRGGSAFEGGGEWYCTGLGMGL